MTQQHNASRQNAPHSNESIGTRGLNQELLHVESEVRFKPGFHLIVSVGGASPRQARGRIGDSCAKWQHFLSDFSDVADQTGTVWGSIERVEMSLKPSLHMIVTVIVSICRRLIGDTSVMRRSRSPTVSVIWKPGFTLSILTGVLINLQQTLEV